MQVLNVRNLVRSVAGVLLLLTVLSCSASGEFEIVTFELGQQRSIQILASEYLEVSRSFYYQVKVDEKVVVPLIRICGGIDYAHLEFKTLLANGGELVGIFERRYPQDILAVHDFKTNASWPSVRSYNSTDEYYKYGEALLEKLQTEHRNLDLRLNNARACGGPYL